MDKFTHMLVANSTHCNGIGTAYMIGSIQECRVYQMAHGLRASTLIIPL